MPTQIELQIGYLWEEIHYLDIMREGNWRRKTDQLKERIRQLEARNEDDDRNRDRRAA